MNKQGNLKRLAGTCAIPAGTLLIFLILGAVQGIPLIATSGHVQLLVRSVATVSLTSFALSINLNSGRFDFSIGSVALLSSVISASCAIKYNLSPGAMLATSLLSGLVLGMISGLLYVILKLPAIITSLGVTLLYEAAAFMITDGKGVSFGTYEKLIRFSSHVPSLLIVIICAAVLMIVLFDHTRFGYNYNALKNGQKVAVDTGLKEIPNAVCCYMISGLLMGMEGYISACLSGTITMSLNFGSIGVMFTAFLPMFIGGFIGRFISGYIGMVLGAFTSAVISLGFVRLDLSAEVQSLVSALILVLFLIYLNNEQSILRFFVKNGNEKESAA